MAFSTGMNTDAVREQAIRIDTVVNELTALSASVEQTVGGLGQQWRGLDLERFQGWWHEQHKPNLGRISEAIAGLAQSLRNNADEQDRASANGNGGGPGGYLHPMPDPVPGGPAPTVGVTPAGRDWTEVQRGYDAWARSLGPGSRFSNPNESQYQCTGWANYRWHELGYDGPPISGHGVAMAGNAPGDVSSEPSLHAMASRGGASGYGHVMIVEEVSGDGSRVRVSEMNIDGNPDVANPNEYSDQRWITRGPDGNFYDNGHLVQFAGLPD